MDQIQALFEKEYKIFINKDAYCTILGATTLLMYCIIIINGSLSCACDISCTSVIVEYGTRRYLTDMPSPAKNHNHESSRKETWFSRVRQHLYYCEFLYDHTFHCNAMVVSQMLTLTRANICITHIVIVFSIIKHWFFVIVQYHLIIVLTVTH